MWVIYRSPSQSVQRFLDEFSDLLELVSVSSGKLLIVGDFNIHVDDPSCSVARKFLSLLDTFGLTQHVNFPTRFQSGRPGHSVDLVLSRSTDKFVVDCYNSDLISDHFSIHTLARVFHPMRPQKTVSYRKIKSIDPVCFSSDLASSPLLSDPSDDLASLLLQYNNLADILDKHAPITTRKVTVRADNPWDCAEIHSIRRNCRKFERIYRKRKLVVDGDIFVSCRDRLHRLITAKKQSYLSTKIAEATGKHSLYKIVDSFLVKKPTLRLPDHNSLEELVCQFNQFFEQKTANIRASLDAADSSSPIQEEARPVPQFSCFSPVSESEIAELIRSCPTKSCPLDPIPTYLLKTYADVLAPAITRIVNKSLSLGVFPDLMKLALVTPLLKKPDLCADDFSNYRPVSNLSFLSKLIERVVVRQFVSHLNESGLFVPVQSAYRAHHSTETALLKVLNDLLLAVDEGDVAILALLDQSAAFDTIDHQILLHRLSVLFGVNGVALSWFKSYLSGRLQCVSVSGVSSPPVPLPYGVPQGSALGPILYILYTYPVYEIALSHNIPSHFFADDSQLYKRFKPTADGAAQRSALSSLSSCISEAKLWMTANKQQLNEVKTDALLVSSAWSRTPLPSPPVLQVGPATIIPSPSVRSLGAIFDSHLRMEGQVRATAKRAFFHLYRISKISKHLTRPAIAQLIQAFVISALDYNNALLFGLPAVTLDKLQRVQNAAARLLTGSRKREHITPHLKSLHWLPINKRIDYKIALLSYKCRAKTAPGYLQELVAPVCASTSAAVNCLPRPC